MSFGFGILRAEEKGIKLLPQRGLIKHPLHECHSKKNLIHVCNEDFANHHNTSYILDLISLLGYLSDPLSN